MNRSLVLALLALGAAVGCSSMDTTDPSTSASSNTPDDMTPTPSGGNTLGATVSKDQTLSGTFEMPQTTTIPAGVKLTLAAGAKILAAKGASLVVKGTLVTEGASGTAAVFQSKAHGGAGEWTGIKLEQGGTATLTHAEIHDADLALEAAVGSSYAIDSVLIDTSNKFVSLSADGTIKHSQFHGLGDDQQDSPFSVTDASPQVTDSVIDKGRTGGVDLIVVDGAGSSPLFDHVEVANAHCVFHFNASKSAKITNSIIHDAVYGMMVIASKGLIMEGNNFQKTMTNIGTCMNGDVTSTGNYFEAGEPFDGACKMQMNTGTSATPVAEAGPRP